MKSYRVILNCGFSTERTGRLVVEPGIDTAFMEDMLAGKSLFIILDMFEAD
jgi:hypothetical protein